MSSPKLVVVTGANKGIGLEIARRLAHNSQFSVILCSRDLAAGQAAATSIGGRVSAMQLDIENEESVKSFAAAVQPNIWALVNNAGIAFKGDAFDESVARTTFSCNYYGTVRITSALLPLLVPGGHVINVSSRAGLLKLVSPELQQRFLAPDMATDALTALCEEFCTSVADGTFASKGWSKTCYGSSKIAMSAYSRVCARLNPTLRINAICPGWCKTDMAGWERPPKTAADGADTVCYLLETDTSATGKFFAERHEIDWVDAAF